jgi:ribosomal protein S18 acetylase RimI-like enzyme
VTTEESRFEPDPEELVPEPEVLPDGWQVSRPDPDDAGDVARLTELLRAHERGGRGWAGAGPEDVLVEVSDHGLRTRQNVVVRDEVGRIRAWGSVHDRAGGRMLFLHVVGRDLTPAVARACSDVLVEWAVGQAREVGAARGLAVQQIDTGAFVDDDRQHAWLAASGFEKVRTWWQMTRPVTPDEVSLVDDPARWELDGVVIRLVEGQADGMPDESDLRKVHDVLEAAFTDHFNSKPETFDEFLFRLREDPGHRWDHWWLAELVTEGGAEPQPVGALVATVSESTEGPDGSYVAYIGVLEAARGRGVAKGLLRTVIADAAARGRDRVGLEVDADSPTGADRLYRGMGWETSYVTESWHRDVPVP